MDENQTLSLKRCAIYTRKSTNHLLDRDINSLVTQRETCSAYIKSQRYPDESVPFTRITEYKHLTGQVHPQTSITREYPCAEGDPYYPVPRAENQALFKRYEALADATENVTFVGRLATYRYFNMDQIVGQALATFRRQFSTAPAPTAPLVATAA